METLFGVLCVATIFFAFVTVIGHGIWVLLAALFKPNRPETRTYRACTSCGAVLAEAAMQCNHCGVHAPRSREQLPGDEVAAAIRQLQRLRSRGLIDATEFDRLVGLLRTSDTSPARQPESTTSPVARPQVTPPVTPPSSPFPFAPVEPAASSAVPEVEFIQAEAVESVNVSSGHSPTRESQATSQSTPPIRPAQPAAHALDRDYASVVPQPSAPRRAIAELLKSFMAEKNIRWGELVSGMLIVGSAVGLVVSLRATLSEAIPYFPALIFMLITLGSTVPVFIPCDVGIFGRPAKAY